MEELLELRILAKVEHSSDMLILVHLLKTQFNLYQDRVQIQLLSNLNLPILIKA